MTHTPNPALRTPGVVATLAAVRKTGKSAHPSAGQTVSDLVFAVAVAHGINPVELQAEVTAYADDLDSLSAR